jgi:putative salt-induced outer membrane protein YdiY
MLASLAAKADEATATGPAVNAPTNAPPNPDVVKDWHGNLALGLSVANGNSSAYSVNAGVALDKEWKTDEWHFGGNGQYAVNNPDRRDQDITAENARGTATYRHLFTDRLYATGGFEAMHDDVADVTYRFITSPGLGYYVVKSPTNRLRLEAGPSWIYERLSGSDPKHNNYFAARVAERGEHDFNKNAKCWEQVEYLPKVDAWGTYLLNAEVGAEALINNAFSLRLVARDQYNSEPPAGSKSNDITVVGALVYKFGPQ